MEFVFYFFNLFNSVVFCLWFSSFVFFCICCFLCFISVCFPFSSFVLVLRNLNLSLQPFLSPSSYLPFYINLQTLNAFLSPPSPLSKTVKMMSSIKEESISSPMDEDEEMEYMEAQMNLQHSFGQPGSPSPTNSSSNPTSPTPGGSTSPTSSTPPPPAAGMQIPNAIRARLEQRSLAQQALLNRALRSRRHTLANVLRPR